MARLSGASQKKVDPTFTGSKTFFLLNCSPQEYAHTFRLIDKAGNALAEIPNLNIEFDSFAGKQIHPCQNCLDRCEQEGRCWQEDDFARLAEHWLSANCILIATPVYTFGPPAPVYAFFERLSALQHTNPDLYRSPNWPQPVGIIAQGGSEYGGAEVCAQSLLSLCLQVGCVPISGDMPGFSQGVIGQITDKGEIPERLSAGVRRLALRVAEVSEILAAGKNQVPCSLRYLIANTGEDRDSGPFFQAINELASTIERQDISIEWRNFNFNDHQIAPCLGCTQYCARDQECIFHDGMQDFRREWQAADGIFWLVGQSRQNAITLIRAAVDRMNQVRFETHFASGYSQMPRYLKVSAPVVFDPSSHQLNSTLLYLQHISLLYQHLLVPGSTGGNFETSAGPAAARSSPFVNPAATDLEPLLLNSVRLAGQVKSGISQLGSRLPLEYFPSSVDFAKAGREARTVNA